MQHKGVRTHMHDHHHHTHRETFLGSKEREFMTHWAELALWKEDGGDGDREQMLISWLGENK